MKERVIINNSSIVLIIFYALGLLVLSRTASKKYKDFVLAKGKFTDLQIVATLFATWTGAGMIFAVTDNVFIYGIAGLATAGTIIQNLINYFFLVEKFEKFKDCVSVGEIIEKFYCRKGRIFSGLVSTMVSISIISLQISAISYFLNDYFGINNKFLTVLIINLIVIFYATLGGIRAIVYTDVLQSAFIVVALVTLLFFMIDKTLIQNISQNFQNKNFVLLKHTSWQKNLMDFIIFVLPASMPVTVQRILMCKTTTQAKRVIGYSIIATTLLNCLLGAIALSAIFLSIKLDNKSLIPTLIKTMTPENFHSLIIVGILAVIMSTIDSFLNSAGISITHDCFQLLYKKRLSTDAKLKITRLSILFIGIFAMFISLFNIKLMELLIVTTSLWLITFAVPLIFILFGRAVSTRMLTIQLLLAVMIFLGLYQSAFQKALCVLLSFLFSILFFSIFSSKNVK